MLKLVALSVVLAMVNAMEFEIRNNEIGAIWVGIQGNPNKEHLHNGGFVLEAGASVSCLDAESQKHCVFTNQCTFVFQTTLSAAEDWAGRFWARTWCDPNTNYCLTGDCGSRLECAGAGGNPPASLAEITLKGAGGLDFYDISLVDGFNIAVAVSRLFDQKKRQD